MNRRLYAIHRWISAFAFLQLAVWTISGSFFALVPIGRVRGTSVDGAHRTSLPQNPVVLSVPTVLAYAAQYGLGEPTNLELRPTPSGLWYVVRQGTRVFRIDARSGGIATVERAEAEETARRDQPGGPSVVGAELITEAPIEYRDQPLPAWRVQLADEGATAVYVDATTGDVTAHRNGTCGHTTFSGRFTSWTIEGATTSTTCS